MTPLFNIPELFLEPGFVERMGREVAANQHKGDWRTWATHTDMTWEALVEEIDHHVEKLEKAAREGNLERIREYAADIANCSMFAFVRAQALEEA